MKYGKKINTLEELHAASLLGRAVVCPWFRAWQTPRPAAVVINLQGSLLVRMFAHGVYLYERTTK